MRVYVVHTGSYSDHCRSPVFSTVEKALAYKAAYNVDAEIKVHLLDEENDTGPRYPVWAILFDSQGTVLQHFNLGPEMYEPRLHDPPGAVKVDKRWYREGWIGSDRRGDVCVYEVHAPDLEHAVKIAAHVRRVFLDLGHT